MKTLGLLGGMSWESSLEYYRLSNEFVKEKLGEPNSCESIMYSVNFAEIHKLQHDGKWDVLTNKMIDGAKKLERAGAELMLICTNTMHKMAPDVQENIEIPLLHIADATAEEIKINNIKRVGLLGTNFTMEQDFYKGRLKEQHGLDVIIPYERDRKIIHDVIYTELISGIFREESKDQFKRIINSLEGDGAQGVILGCTEIPLLIKNKDSIIPVFDTTVLHVKKAIEYILEKSHYHE